MKPPMARSKNTSTSVGRAKSRGRVFPKGFLFGTATAATQIDGGDSASDWAHWCAQAGRIQDGSSCVTACDHWNRYEADFRLMQQLGVNSYRLGVDWSRFEPRPGERDAKAVAHFRKMLGALRKRKIRPLLTLSHFAVPQWWLDRGGWVKAENTKAFLDFVQWIVPQVGDLVYEYITFNEPNVYALFAYMDGRWPPGRGGLGGYFESQAVLRNQLLAHFQMYDFIRETHARKGWTTPAISIAKHLRVFDPIDPESALDRDRKTEAEKRFNLMFLDGIHTGRLPRPLGKGEKVHDGNAWEFLGINYYSRTLVGFNLFAPQMLFIKTLPNGRPDAPKNDLDWEIYPEGLTRLLKDMYHRYRLPIRITENGIAARDDRLRVDFLRSHLAAVLDAMEGGVPVDAYYHWSFMDNFEWAEGYEPRFGLVGVDFANQKRTIKPSGKLFAKIARGGRVV